MDIQRGQEDWRPDTLAVRSGLARSGFEETAEALYLTSGFVYDSAEAAEADEPGPDYRVGDLTDVEVPRLASAAEEANVAEGFDAILCAGNVMTFLHPATRVEEAGEIARGTRVGADVQPGGGQTPAAGRSVRWSSVPVSWFRPGRTG